MERRRFTREFKLEAVRLIRDRGVSYAQAAEDLKVHPTQLRNWVKAFADDPQHAFPGQGQMKPEQLEIARLKREVIKLKAERDILKKSRGLLREGIDVKFGFIAKHRGIWPADWLCGALGVSRGGFYAWLSDHAVGAAAAMKRSVPRFGRASLPAIGPTAPGACGMIFWPKASHAVCIGSSD